VIGLLRHVLRRHVRAALAVPGCDGLEFDVRLSRDGIPVVLHDATLERVQGRPERAPELTAAELGALGVPTLAAVLAAVPPPAFLDVELKEDLGEAVVDVLRSARGSDLADAAVSSFSGDHRIGIDAAPARLLCCERNRLQELLVGVRWTELGRSRSGALALSARLTALSPRSGGLRQRNPNPRPLSLHAFSRRAPATGVEISCGGCPSILGPA
jgi:glycerophosphoryl diester phosphodiesterase